MLLPLRTRWHVDVEVPASVEDTTRRAAEAAATGIDAVFAAGGDGTAAAVARGIAGSRTSLGILPLGTANDLARALGVSRTPETAAERATHAAPRTVDMVRVDDSAFCTVGGLGIVTASALAATRLRRGGDVVSRLARGVGGAIYKLTALGALLSPRTRTAPVELVVTTPLGEERAVALRSPGLFVANQRFLGGGLALPGVAAPDDGVFELLLVHDVARVRLLDAFTRLSLHLPIPGTVLSLIPARAARIRCAADDTFLGDGDALGTGREFELRAEQRVLRVLV